MITFLTKAEFEDAVMAVLNARLAVDVTVWRDRFNLDEVQVQVTLRDTEHEDVIDCSEGKG